jgi:aminopeptidase N
MPEQAAYDVTFHDLRLTVDPYERTIHGTMTIHANIVEGIQVFVLHLDSLLDVTGVRTGTGDELTGSEFSHEEALIRVQLAAPVTAGERLIVEVEYGGSPREAPMAPWVGGFVWSQTPGGDPWIATAVQGEGADVWWPCKDHPSDEPDSMSIRIRVPDPLVVASNGRLRGVEPHPDGWSTHHWFVSTPVNNYGVAINIAPYRTIEGSYRSVTGEEIPITFWVIPEHYEQGKGLFPQFAEHLAFYEKYLGPYPFRADKYGVAETPHLGMEHQTIIAYGANFQDNEDGYDGLHHHELGHEWWGNLVTAPDWNDFWIHEGFCSYMQPLYAEELHGKEAYHRSMSSRRSGIRNRIALAPREPMSLAQMDLIPPDYTQRDGDAYNKGKWVLHTLRYLIGDEAFFASLRRMAYPDPATELVTDGTQTRFGTTDEFVRIAEEVSGKDLVWFFEVYARQPQLPVLVRERVSDGILLRWDVPGGLEFPMPVEVQIGDERRRVDVPAAGAVVTTGAATGKILVDPDNWILKEWG